MMIYFTSEQLFGPTGSLKQFDIDITAASMDASSPCDNQGYIYISVSYMIIRWSLFNALLYNMTEI